MFVDLDGLLHEALALYNWDVANTNLRAEGLALGWIGTGRLIFKP